MILPTLYALASNGKTKEWTVSTQDDVLIVEHGYVDGAKQVSRKAIKGKSIGRSNETTPAKQAELEAQSAWNLKKDKGYTEDLESDRKFVFAPGFLPMLAHVFEEKKHLIKFPCFVQPKLDGMRCLAGKVNGKVVLWSRGTKAIEGLTEIEASLLPLLQEGYYLDGELYVHGWTLQRVIRAVKKRNEDTPNLEYHVYDAPVPALSFHDRWGRVLAFEHKLYPAGIKNIAPVPTVIIHDEKDLAKWEEIFVKEGYEGAIYRSDRGEYKFGHRSSDLLKIKRFQDAEFEIVGAKEGEGKDEGTPVFTCLTEDGKEFDVRPTGSVELRREMWKNRAELMHRQLVVKYPRRTEDNKPFNPVGKCIKEEE